MVKRVKCLHITLGLQFQLSSINIVIIEASPQEWSLHHLSQKTRLKEVLSKSPRLIQKPHLGLYGIEMGEAVQLLIFLVA